MRDSQALGTRETVYLLRYAPKNRSSPRAETEKWLLKKQKLKDSKLEAGPARKLKAIKKAINTLIRSQTQISRTHIFVSPNAIKICVEKTVTLCKFNSVYKPRDINVLFS